MLSRFEVWLYGRGDASIRWQASRKADDPLWFVRIFFVGDLALTAMVGDEVSFTNAICQIITIGFAHYTLTWARSRSQRGVVKRSAERHEDRSGRRHGRGQN